MHLGTAGRAALSSSRMTSRLRSPALNAMLRVTITRSDDRGYQEFPDDPDLREFDADDRRDRRRCEYHCYIAYSRFASRALTTACARSATCSLSKMLLM
jgi:hypothetical protein